MQAQAPAKAENVREYLKQRALEMRTVTYGEVSQATGLAAAGVGRQLGYIHDEICRRRGIPWLNALVVNASTRRPGENFLPEQLNEPTTRDSELFWRCMVLQVYASDWRDVPFNTDVAQQP